MATKRIDFRKEDGGWVAGGMSVYDYFIRSNERYVINFLNWIVTIDTDDVIIIESTSKAKRTRKNRFRRKLEEGSLFLFNSTSDWYWYFRPKKVQQMLDLWGISKINSVETIPTQIQREFYAYIDKEGKMYPSTTLNDGVTLKYYSPYPVKEELDGMARVEIEGGDDIYFGQLKLNFLDWILIEDGEGHREIFLEKTLRLEDIQFEDYDINLDYPQALKG